MSSSAAARDELKARTLPQDETSEICAKHLKGG